MASVPSDRSEAARRDDRLERLLTAVIAVGSELSLPVVLTRIVEAATHLVDATYGALGVIDDATQTLSEFITVGVDESTIEDIGALPQGQGILGLLIVQPEPLRLSDLSEHPDSYGMPAGHPPMTSFLGVPIRVRGEVFGNLYLTDKRSGDVFDEGDEELAVALAAVAGMAIENARLHARLSDLILVEDRERIARDLHDTVIQRLFATGLALQGLAGRVTDDELAERLAHSVDDLDDTVRHIRTTVFELQRPRFAGRSVRREILDLASEAHEGLGFAVSTRFDGAVDTLIDDATADQVLAVTREALTNTVRHASASRVDVELRAAGDTVTVTVIDDGKGIPDEIRDGARGLANLRTRAEALGGRCTITSSEQGTRVEWTVPLG